MNTLAFLSQKGGSGKTTLAVHCSVAAVEAGEDVTLLDCDPQGSALTWANSRRQETPLVVKGAAHSLGNYRNSRAKGLLIVDGAPHAAPEMARLAEAASLVCIPCRPTAFDLAAVASTVEIVRAISAKAVFVLSACPPRAPEIELARSALVDFGFPVFPGQITELRSFARAVATGRAVTEFETHGRAADEIRSLWPWLNTEMRNVEAK